MPFLSEALRVLDGHAEAVSFHEARMNKARRALWGLASPVRLDCAYDIPPEAQTGTFKLRVSYGPEIESWELIPYVRPRPESLRLVDGGDIDYAFKYADRSQLDALKAQRGDADDILIVKEGHLSDSSSGNVVFWDGQNWLTPSTPLLRGTRRTRLLASGTIREAELRPEDLPRFRCVSIINAMNDLGGIVLPIDHIQT